MINIIFGILLSKKYFKQSGKRAFINGLDQKAQNLPNLEIIKSPIFITKDLELAL